MSKTIRKLNKAIEMLHSLAVSDGLSLDKTSLNYSTPEFCLFICLKNVNLINHANTKLPLFWNELFLLESSFQNCRFIYKHLSKFLTNMAKEAKWYDKASLFISSVLFTFTICSIWLEQFWLNSLHKYTIKGFRISGRFYHDWTNLP